MTTLDKIENWLEKSLLSKLCEKLVDWIFGKQGVPENQETLKTKNNGKENNTKQDCKS